jgi:PAS domain S-box-containing protein
VTTTAGAQHKLGPLRKIHSKIGDFSVEAQASVRCTRRGSKRDQAVYAAGLGEGTATGSLTSDQIVGLGLLQVVRGMRAAVIVVEAPSRRIIYSNASAREMTEMQLGRTVPAELTEDWEIFHQDGQPYRMEEWPLVRSITSGENVVDEDCSKVLPDGSRLLVHCSSAPIYDYAGGIVAGVLVMDDVTARTELEEEHAHYAGLLENMVDAVIATDDRFVVTAWNKGAEAMFGWSRPEALGRPVYELLPQGYSDEQLGDDLRELRQTGRWRGERVWFGKGGTPVHAEGLTVAVRAGQRPEAVGYLCIMRDVAESKRAGEQSAYHAGLLDIVEDGIVGTDREFRLTAWSRGAERLYGHTAEEVLGRHARDVASYVGDTARVELEQELLEGGRTRGEITAIRKDGTPVEVELIALAFRDEQDEITGYIGVHRDISERKRLEQERQMRTLEQAVVARLGMHALASNDVQGLMDEAVTAAAHTLEVELATVAELLPGGEDLSWRAANGWSREAVANSGNSPMGPGSLVGYTTTVGEPVISRDVVTDERFEISNLFAAANPVSAISVVIPGRDEPFGVLTAAAKSSRDFGEDDVNFLQAVANVLGTAAERSRSEERVRQVRDEERHRIARDLHDEALQELTLAVAEGERLATTVQGPAPGRLVLGLKRLGQQLRSAIYDLRLEEQEGRPFGHLLQALTTLHGAQAVDCEIELDIRDNVPTVPLGHRGTEILRLVGEALTNARRHSKATFVRVAAWASDEHLFIEVADDGRGFDPPSRPTGATGTGIVGMRERAVLIAAELTVSSKPGTGTKVRLDVPLSESKESQPRKVRVLLVEDHVAVRQAIAAMFERDFDFDVAGQAGTLAEARGMLDDIDVAVVDLGLPDGYGGDLIKELAEVNPRAQSLVLSASLDRTETARAIESGAAGALDKMAQLDEIVDAVRRLQAGETLLPLDEVVDLLRFASHRREQEHQDRAALEALTPREREVLQAMAEGLGNQAIADRLHISVRTERNHVANILGKLGVHSQLQALVFALRYGIIEVR